MKKFTIQLSAILLGTILVFGTLGIGNSFAQTPSSDGRTIKQLAVVSLVDPDRVVPKQKPGTFSYIFEACAGNSPIRGPEVVVSSDSESKKVKLSHNLKANECQISVVKIKSSSKDLITASLIERGGMSKIIIEQESKITEIKNKLQTEKDALSKLTKESPKPADYSKKVSDITDKIVKLRKDLNDARQTYYRLVYLLHT